MALFVQPLPSQIHTSPHPPFIGDPDTGLLHRAECPAGPRVGVAFGDRQAAATQGYACCKCATPALVASTDRIRALLATTLSRR